MRYNCPDCGALLKQKDISKNKCWKCGSTSIQEEFKNEWISDSICIEDYVGGQDTSDCD